MKSRKFAVLILTHGRADNIQTDKTLRRQGYTGDIYYIIDDEDEQEQKYRNKYGDKVVQFCKEDYYNSVDKLNPEAPRGVILYARNASFDIAKELGLTHFVQFDDDYKEFHWRFIENEKLKGKSVKNLDKVFNEMLDFLDETGALTVALAQDGDFIGGANGGNFRKKILRKAMNSFFCKVDNPFQFIGAVNEDVNTYVLLGNRGKIFLTETLCSLVQEQTQKSMGGMTEAYLDFGTYVKSFYTVMLCPSCVKIRMVGSKDLRIHHNVIWKNAVPKILNEKYRK